MRDLKTMTIMFRASNKLEEIVKKEVATFGLSLSEFMVLEALHHKGKLSVNAVLDKVLIPNSSLSYVLELLVSKGLIIREQDENDRRVYVLSLTEAGRAFIKKVYPSHKKKLRERLDRLSEEEEKTLQSLLKKIGKD